MLPLMNALDFDAMTLHWEFAYGPARVRQLAAGLAYPALAINIYDKAWDRLALPTAGAMARPRC
jgi:2',3'-cyclic-nucleotide 2'-phosphodiesterase (5'-nucleotidase family)